MRLRADFTEAICRLYLEKHKPDYFMKLVEQETRDASCYSLAKIVLHKRSFYDLINNQEGFLALQSYFVKATFLLDRENQDFDLEGACQDSSYLQLSNAH